MSINSTLQIGVQGVQQNLRGMEKAAGEIASVSVSSESVSGKDLAEPLVDLKLYQRGAEASLKVVQTADEMLGTLLDLKA